MRERSGGEERNKGWELLAAPPFPRCLRRIPLTPDRETQRMLGVGDILTPPGSGFIPTIPHPPERGQEPSGEQRVHAAVRRTFRGQPAAPDVLNQGITESLRLGKPSEVMDSNHSPALGPPLKRVPKCHIHADLNPSGNGAPPLPWESCSGKRREIFRGKHFLWDTNLWI